MFLRYVFYSTLAAVVDPYIEREMLLVIMDIVLHRKPAFRHLLFHRFHSSNIKNTSTICRNYSTNDYLIKCTINMLCSLLMYDLLAGSLSNVDVGVNHAMESFLKKLVVSCAEYSSMFLGSSFILCMFRLKTSNLWSQMFVAILTPAIYVKASYSFLLIWDKTDVVRWICLLLVSTFQLLFLTIMLEKYYYKRIVSVSYIGILSLLVGKLCEILIASTIRKLWTFDLYSDEFSAYTLFKNITR